MVSFSSGLSIAQAAIGQIGAVLGSMSTGNAPALMSLGGFKFSLNTLAFSQMTRTTEAAWAFIPQVGRLEAGQFTGPGSDVIEIPGILYPQRFGSTVALDQLRIMQGQGYAWPLILGDGSVLGNWAILAIRETRSNFNAQTNPLKVEFSITLKQVS
ncbi:phage tail protein [Nguyenibacter vanlangensis]|uniref:Phage tail protein n=1 Tax=Nguyenibacter vanlangensis TaxID=1216886 RepID=A0ABZ3D1S0_9PROT